MMLASLDEFKSSLKIGIFGAEPWTNAMRAEIEQSFDSDATDIYGLSEATGPGVRQEGIESKDCLHIWEKVTGRSDDMIILRGVHLFPTQIEQVLLATDQCGRPFPDRTHATGRMDEMTAHAEARPGYSDGNGLVIQAER